MMMETDKRILNEGVGRARMILRMMRILRMMIVGGGAEGIMMWVLWRAKMNLRMMRISRMMIVGGGAKETMR